MAPLVLLRNGDIREIAVLPPHVEVYRHRDRSDREVLVVLDATSERRLLAAQPRQRPGARRAADRQWRQPAPEHSAAA
jgi:hypothetical protein